MPEYLTPGVYIEELQTGNQPIEGVSTSTVGFLGIAERGTPATRLITQLLRLFPRLWRGWRQRRLNGARQSDDRRRRRRLYRWRRQRSRSGHPGRRHAGSRRHRGHCRCDADQWRGDRGDAGQRRRLFGAAVEPGGDHRARRRCRRDDRLSCVERSALPRLRRRGLLPEWRSALLRPDGDIVHRGAGKPGFRSDVDRRCQWGRLGQPCRGEDRGRQHLRLSADRDVLDAELRRMLLRSSASIQPAVCRPICETRTGASRRSSKFSTTSTSIRCRPASSACRSTAFPT